MRAGRDRLSVWGDEAMNTLTCVYCGHEYQAGTPASGADVKVLTDHIKVCEKHPMREAEATIRKLKSALSGLVGASKKDELEAMEMFIRTAPAPDADKAAIINAIHVLIELDGVACPFGEVK